MTEIAKHLQEVPSANELAPSVEASPFLHEGGQWLTNESSNYVPAEQVLGMLARYEGRVDGLVERLADTSTDLVETNRALEVERRAALGARHRVQVKELETRQQIEEITHTAEKTQMRAHHEAETARLRALQAEREAARSEAKLEEAKTAIDDLKQRLEVADELSRTPWYAFRRRKALEATLVSLPAFGTMKPIDQG